MCFSRGEVACARKHVVNRCGEQRRRDSRRMRRQGPSRTQTRPDRFLQLMRERQNKAYDLVRKEDFLVKAKHQAVLMRS